MLATYENIHHHRVLHPTFIFSRCCSPPQSICSPTYTAHSSRTTRQASKQQREGESFWGRPFFLLFWSRKQKATTRTTCLPALPYHEPATANRRTVNCDLETKTTMCDYTKVEYACYHLRYTVRAWCKSTYFSGHLLLFFLFFLSFLSFYTYISMSTGRLTLSICVFLGVKYQETHKVPTYLTLTFFSFFPFFRHIFAGLLLVTLQLAMLFRNKQWMLIYSSTSYSAVSGKCGSCRISSR